MFFPDANRSAAIRERISPVALFFFITAVLVLFAVSAAFLSTLAPVAEGAFTPTTFRIAKGESSLDVASEISRAGLVRSGTNFLIYAVLTGAAFHFHDGAYYFAAPPSVPELAARISGAKTEVVVRIPDGSTVHDIDALLAADGVIPPGDLIALGRTENIEGRLFPDTYHFFEDSSAEDVAAKFADNFSKKAAPILDKDPANEEQNLILASIVEKEVPDLADQKIVAGILKKRLAGNVPLQIDASVCYVKVQIRMAAKKCYPLSPDDFKIDSPYNTYRYKGLPPGPIGSPGLSAIEAALDPQSSPYWYYLSDPKTGKTIYAKTLDEQTRNRTKYLSD